MDIKRGDIWYIESGYSAVSYTHLTLPTNREVQIQEVAVFFTKKKDQRR